LKRNRGFLSPHVGVGRELSLEAGQLVLDDLQVRIDGE